MHGWLEALDFLLLPSHCLLCGQRGSQALDLCARCRDELPWQRHCCRTCASPLSGDIDTAICGRCLKNKPLHTAAFAPLRYEYPVAQLIQAFKFRGAQPAGRVLGDLFSASLPFSESLPQGLLPVPLHASRERERGFNQAAVLAHAVGRQYRIPVLSDTVQRTRPTAEQSGMTATARRRNIRNAFALQTQSLPAHVAVVDDVMTTGSTLAEITRLLRRAGVLRVDVWTLARTP